MPVENELKFILSDDLSEKDFQSWEQINIVQGYLDDGLRLRRYNDEFLFTYKRWIEDEELIVEIENPISQLDFDRLWPYTSNRISKTRYIKYEDKTDWAVDFLKDHNNKVYFIICEAEMPENMEDITCFPKKITDFVIFHVSKGDTDYTNQRLSDINHALSLLEKIGKDGAKCP